MRLATQWQGEAVLNRTERRHLGMKRINLWPVISGHEHHVGSRLPGLAKRAGEVGIETNHIGESPIGRLDGRHLAISWWEWIRPRNRVGLLVAPDDAAGRVKQDGLVEHETRRYRMLQSHAHAQIQVGARRTSKRTGPRKQADFVFLQQLGPAFGPEDDLGPGPRLLQAEQEQLIVDTSIRLTDELALSLRLRA
jgi:hypothetical protein